MKVIEESKITLELNRKEHGALFALLGKTSQNDLEKYVSSGQAQVLYAMWLSLNEEEEKHQS